MKKTLLLIIITIIVSMTGYATEFHTQTINSEVNKKNYTLFYHLPNNYINSGKKYPVIFVLNCEWIFTSYIQSLKRLNLDQKVILIGIGYGMGPNYKMINELIDYKIITSADGLQSSSFKKVLLTELIPSSIANLPIDNKQILIYGNRETSQFLTYLAFDDPERQYHYLISNLEVEKEFVRALKRIKPRDSSNVKFFNLINCDQTKKKQENHHQAIINLYNTNNTSNNGVLSYYSTSSKMPLHTSSTAMEVAFKNIHIIPIESSTEIATPKEFEYTIQLSQIYSKKIKDTMLIYSFARIDSLNKSKTLIVNLDSDLDFLLQAKICDSLFQQGLIENFVLVGAGSGVDLGSYGVKRFRDLMHIRLRGYDSSGGGYNYWNFLSNDLVTFSDSMYGKCTHKILSGHSLGGVFTAISSIDSCKIFDGYLISSPAFHVYKKRFITSLLKQSTLCNHYFFLSIGELEEEKGMKMVSDIISFNNELIKKGIPKDRLKFLIYKTHNHVSIMPEAFADGITYLINEMPVE